MKEANVLFRLVFAVTIIMSRAFYKGNGIFKKDRILSYGVNQIGNTKGQNPGIHAECDAILKLRPLKNKKNFNLLIYWLLDYHLKIKFNLVSLAIIV